MSPRASILGTLALASLLATAACSPMSNSARPPAPPDVKVVIGSDQDGISVTGRGEVSATPDVARLSIGVEAKGRTVADARSAAASAAERLYAALEKSGVERKDIQTSDLSVQPRYEHNHVGEPRLVGYVVSNQVTAKVRKVQEVGSVLDQAVAAGGDAIRVNGVSFDVEQLTELKQRARARALEDARAKAEQLARLVGARLGEPVVIDEAGFAPPPPIWRSMAEAQSATPVSPGTNLVSVDIKVRWRIAAAS